MDLNLLKKITLISLFFYLPLQTMAWGMLGHRIVGEIADSYLNAKTRIEIKKILGNESIAMASNWGDFIKSDTTYDYLEKWHYVDFERGTDYDQMQAILKNDTTTNAYTKLNMLISGLKSKSLSQDKKLFYLRMLIHIMGDISQPLHVGYAADEGGNKVKVSWFNASTNLHSIWDSRLIDDQKLSYTEYTRAINFSTLQQRLAWQKGGLNGWIYDSFQVTQSLYLDVKEGDKLSYQYIFKHLDTVNKQLLKGGVRLAYILNTLFA